jgi:hypothetical protein
MTAERLTALIEAYGADPARWPAADRALGQAALADPVLRAAVDEARALDRLLEASRPTQPSAALRDRVLAGALRAGLTGPRRSWSFDPLTWLSGAGWAAAAFAGVLAGGALASDWTADLKADAVLYQASLAPIDDVEVLG